MSPSFGTASSESSNLDGDFDNDDLDSLIPSSPSAYTHTFTSPAPEQLERKSIGVLGADQDKITHKKALHLPIEVIDYIASFLFDSCQSGCFVHIRSFSLVCSQFRHVALRHYFSSIRIASAKQLAAYTNFHYSLVSRRNAPCDSVGFDYVKLWRIDVPLLKIVASAFPSVKILHLSCSEQLDVSCCWPCFEESSTAVVHSPIPNYFNDITELTDNFADSLEPLTQLTDLHLGIFLSDEEMVEKHIEHYDTPLAFDHTLRTASSPKAASPHIGNILSQLEAETTTGLISYSVDQDSKIEESHPGACTDDDLPFPHGPELCRTCKLIGSASKVRTRELEASLALARKLKTLRTVGWSSFFTSQVFEVDKVGDWRRRTTTHILRVNGRVRVRRRPW
ncbi:hypothetical protein EDD22DRAFT_821754 [Suillus occidentalis]|nr:hypothetical protein EDD22DRAFT_821754 [Suillus occidentalis]